jgi:hypothetical protein
VKFTQNMTTHINGGSEFSELHYRVAADGRETPVIHHQRTAGSPKYLITNDWFRCMECDVAFDNRAARGVGLRAWLEAHAHRSADVPAEKGTAS